MVKFRGNGAIWRVQDFTPSSPARSRFGALLFSRSIRVNPDGSYYLQVAEERAPITVEDTPYVVTTVEDGTDGDDLVVVTNDGERERLDPTTLEVGRDDVLYCRVKGGRFRARFLRSAYYHLSGRFEATDDGRFVIRIGGRRFPIRPTL
jgi:hypothetical protein